MASNSDGLWLDDLLSERTNVPERMGGVEKKLRFVSGLVDELFLLLRINKYPIILDKPQYKVTVGKLKDKKWVKIYEEEDMELLPLLTRCEKFLKKYRDDHKDYILTKPGGGDII